MSGFALIAMGISGSGKSLLAKKLSSYFDIVIVEPDNIRRELFGNVNEQKDGHLVFEKAAIQIRKAIHNDELVYFDATNTKLKDLKSFMYNNVDVERSLIIIMKDSFNKELCKSRVKKDIESGKDRSKVPDEVIDRQYNNFINSIKLLKENEILNTYQYDDFKFDDLRKQIEELI